MRFFQKIYVFILFGACLLFLGIPVELGMENAVPQGFTIPKPVIRIGLCGDLKDIRIHSSSGMKIYEAGKGYALLAQDVDEVHVKGGSDKITKKFVILLGRAQDRKEAEIRAAGFRKTVTGMIRVTEDREGEAPRIFDITLGDFLTREEAKARLKVLQAAGLKDLWIRRVTIAEAGSRPLWILVGSELKPLSRESVVYFIPAEPQSYLAVNGRSYRGFLTMKGGPAGIVLVNVVHLEDYLKSVVPGELPPAQFTALEALKAQAVAARTYALKNVGQFDELGYDLLDTPRSQLYMGMSMEHPLSNQAVDETRGEVMMFRDSLINALYTSTCGGKTEDAENVFGGLSVPYLKSVECRREKQPLWLLETKTLVPFLSVDGRHAGLDIALLIGAGIVPPGATALDFHQDATPGEAVEWIRRTRRFIGIKDDRLATASGDIDFVSLARLFVAAFGWQERADELLLPGEVDFILKDLPHIESDDRRALAYCIQSSLFPASVKSGNPLRTVSRAELAVALSRIVRDSRDIFHSGTFRTAAKSSIEVVENGDRRTLALATHVPVLRTMDGQTTSVAKLTLLGGENIRWVERVGLVTYIEVLFPPNSNVLDRSSLFNHWQVRKTRQELDRQLDESCPVGRLIDLNVRSRGVSGRATELLVTGTNGETTIHGFQIREALGLRDTLFVIDRTYNEKGQVESFIFSGRGWGHGVGLCQVGAYGMALSGAKYRGILKKYYRGITFKHLY